MTVGDLRKMIEMIDDDMQVHFIMGGERLHSREAWPTDLGPMIDLWTEEEMKMRQALAPNNCEAG